MAAAAISQTILGILLSPSASRNRRRLVLLSHNKRNAINSYEEDEEGEDGLVVHGMGRGRRRELLLSLPISLAAANSISSPFALAEEAPSVEDPIILRQQQQQQPSPPPQQQGGEEQYGFYSDETNKFSISVPQDWVRGEAESTGYRSVTAFFPKGQTTSNVSVVVTTLSPDFTKLESLGSLDEFAESLVNGMDRSWQKPPGLAAKLIDSKKKNGMYYIEYSLQYPREKMRHIYSATGIAFIGWYNKLYTVTGQFFDEEANKYSTSIQKSVSSFRLI